MAGVAFAQADKIPDDPSRLKVNLLMPIDPKEIKYSRKTPPLVPLELLETEQFLRSRLRESPTHLSSPHPCCEGFSVRLQRKR